MTVKPLGQLKSKQTKTPHSIDNFEPHSRHRAEASKHYHQEVVGKQDTGQFGDKAIERLNPTKTRPAVRSFPGLANWPADKLT